VGSVEVMFSAVSNTVVPVGVLGVVGAGLGMVVGRKSSILDVLNLSMPSSVFLR